MNKSAAIMELVAGYDAYTRAEELNVSAVADAPATTWPCAVASAYYISQSSPVCGASVSAVSGFTLGVNC